MFLKKVLSFSKTTSIFYARKDWSFFITVSLFFPSKSHNIRFRAGSRHSEGRVEIRHEGRWGTICDDGWDITDANVACRQMGFGTAYEATHYASFGQGVGKVWVFNYVSEVYIRNLTKITYVSLPQTDLLPSNITCLIQFFFWEGGSENKFPRRLKPAFVFSYSRCGWIRWFVMEQREIFITAAILAGVLEIVVTLKMQAWNVIFLSQKIYNKEKYEN